MVAVDDDPTTLAGHRMATAEDRLMAVRWEAEADTQMARHP